jgi:hypothetical protein
VNTLQEVRLGDLVPATLTITRGFPTQRAVETGDVRVMSVAGLRSAAPPRHFAERVDITDSDLAQPGDVLVAIEGGTVGETLVVPEGVEEFVPAQQAATLRVHDRSLLDPWYLGAWLTSEPAAEQLRRLARGLGGSKNMSESGSGHSRPPSNRTELSAHVSRSCATSISS